MSGLTYDTGALLAVEARRRDVWSLHATLLLSGGRPVVPAGVLAQAWRGGPQAEMSRLLRGCVIEPFDELRARDVGAACARARTRDVVAAAVVLGALARGDRVVTSDPDDLLHLADALGRKLRVLRI